ncbi:fluoride efflux transporter FluC [Microbacterium sp. bgisy189]|uniref:fluoride efflux transporter FluC n=1 Tax=Microbacterium sp. bgisy189 TaxID=3413798 RepID=UPI003EBB4F5A
MNGLELVALIGGGALGAGARYVIDGLLMRGRREAFPVGIVVVNVTGSFLLGLLTGMGAVVGAVWLAILGIGLLGGFTTFSTVSVETVLLAQRGRRDWAWVNLLGTLAVAVVAAGIGIMLGGLLPR